MEYELILVLVLRLSQGSLRVPLKRAATILGLEPQTLRNQLSLGICDLEPLKDGRSVFFLATDLARKIEVTLPKRRGRPTNAQRAARKTVKTHG